MTSPSAKIEIVTRSERRRFSADEKLAIVRETLSPRASVGEVARRCGISSGLLYTWRKRALAGAMAGFVPVVISGDERPALAVAGPSEESPAAPGSPRHADRGRSIEVELPNGWRVLVGGDADAGALQRVFSALALLR
jgi:transposase